MGTGFLSKEYLEKAVWYCSSLQEGSWFEPSRQLSVWVSSRYSGQLPHPKIMLVGLIFQIGCRCGCESLWLLYSPGTWTGQAVKKIDG